ncbi:hypothetical protein [Tolypothrix sp. VBCCA 56010]|uniref:hypothetical protein n=1 Tax=Tolypothrix sp. VBCCA 56010 TaxID=3137731 RepID=UPI003D7CC7BE
MTSVKTTAFVNPDTFDISLEGEIREAKVEVKLPLVLYEGVSKASANGDKSGNLFTFASSDKMAPGNHAGSTTIYVTSYTIEGNNEVVVPLTFNLEATASLEAQAIPGVLTDVLTSVYYTAVFGSDSGSFEYLTGSAGLAMPYGVREYSETGFFYSNGTVKDNKDLVLKLAGGIDITISEDEQNHNNISDINFSEKEAVIDAIKASGLLEKYKIDPNEVFQFELSYKSSYKASVPFQVKVDVLKEGNLSLNLNSSAMTLPYNPIEFSNDAKGSATGKLSINAVTLPINLGIDPFSIKVRFDDGTEEPVFPEVSGNIIKGQDISTTVLNSQSNPLVGTALDDIIRGGNGNDVIKGLAGNNYLEGQAGLDQFFFGSGKPFDVSMGIDTIIDFNSSDDTIILEKATFSALGNEISFASVNSIEEAQSSYAFITYVPSSGFLFYNPNGIETGFQDGGQFARLLNKATLTASNFTIAK